MAILLRRFLKILPVKILLVSRSLVKTYSLRRGYLLILVLDLEDRVLVESNHFGGTFLNSDNWHLVVERLHVILQCLLFEIELFILSNLKKGL
jgi:hypothetical protein